MTIESVTYIDDLNATYPESNTSAGDGDDHLRNIKTALLNSFPGVTGAVTATQAELNYLDITTLGTAAASKALVADGSANINANAITWSDLGTVTTVDINGGSVDGAAIGANSASTGAFTTLTASSTLAVTGASTLTGNVTLGGTLGFDGVGTTVNEISTDGTLAGDSDDAVPTEKAVKAYCDSLDFATETYVDNRARVAVSCRLDLSTSGENAAVPIPVAGTIVRVDTAWQYDTAADSSTITVKTAANSAVASTTADTTTFGIDSDTSPTNTSVSAGDALKVAATATSTQVGRATVTVLIAI